MDLPGALRCYYADTLGQLGHYTEYVYEYPGGAYFAQAPSRSLRHQNERDEFKGE